MDVLPRGDGYGPFKSFTVFTAALPVPCRGAPIEVFAGTARRLYKLDKTDLTWDDIAQQLEVGIPASTARRECRVPSGVRPRPV